MAVTFGNKEASLVLNSTVVITRPTGLVVGDIVFAHLSAQGASTTQTWSPPAGFISLQNSGATGVTTMAEQTFYKVAVQADVDATSFSFIPSSGGGNQFGTVFNVKGGLASTITYAVNNVTTNNTVTTTGLTPFSANSLLVMIGSIVDGTKLSVTQASYSIATSNPTWTEQYDNFSDTYNTGHAIASASRPEATATGVSTVIATPNSGTVDVYFQVLISISDIVNYTIDVSTGTFATTFSDISISNMRIDVNNFVKPSSGLINQTKP